MIKLGHGAFVRGRTSKRETGFYFYFILRDRRVHGMGEGGWTRHRLNGVARTTDRVERRAVNTLVL